MDWLGELIRKALDELFGRCKCPAEIEMGVHIQAPGRDNNGSTEGIDAGRFCVGGQ